MEHPLISKVNQTGYVERSIQITTCQFCGNELYEGDKVIDWEGDLFCDSDCLVDQFLKDKEHFGVIEIKL